MPQTGQPGDAPGQRPAATSTLGLVASDTVTATNAANRDDAQPVHAALDASTPFTEVSNGFAGAESDGLTQLDRDHALTTTFADGLQGDLVQTARGRPVRRPRRHPRPRVRRHPGEAVATAGGALRTGFSRALLRHAAGWADYAHMVGSARPGQVGRRGP